MLFVLTPILYQVLRLRGSGKRAKSTAAEEEATITTKQKPNQTKQKHKLTQEKYDMVYAPTPTDDDIAVVKETNKIKWN